MMKTQYVAYRMTGMFLMVRRFRKTLLILLLLKMLSFPKSKIAPSITSTIGVYPFIWTLLGRQFIMFSIMMRSEIHSVQVDCSFTSTSLDIALA